ncbi:MAG TPA: hypothetical protein VGO62_07110 [Myxococcota bacterium]
MTTLPPNVAGYTQQEIDAVVAQRCGEISARLSWPLAQPTVRVLDPDALKDAVAADIHARETQVRGAPHEASLLERMTSWIASIVNPPTLGYFGTSNSTLHLNGVVVPQQAGYVLLHELVHAAQWQRAPGLFAAIDAARVAAGDTMREHGADSAPAKKARDRYESLVTFIEGHATFHGRHALIDRLTRDVAYANMVDVKKYVEQMMALDLSDENTQLIYVRGERALAELDSARVEALFADPDRVVALFTRA